jgi:hypothetical protein
MARSDPAWKLHLNSRARAAVGAPPAEMPLMIPRPFAHRPAAPRCRGGASSLLRLSSNAAPRWPSATALTEWIARVARADTAGPIARVAPANIRASHGFDRLWPSVA